MAQSDLRRDSYHHGDLANALTLAATELARHGGPEAVVLREAARQVGVSPTAAYRHFAGRGDLIHEVKALCQTALAEYMAAEVAAGTPAADPQLEAIRRLRALGRGYLRFAQAEPGLFSTAYSHPDTPREKTTFEMIDSPALTMLSAVLDDMASLGLIDPSRRPFAELVAWSSTHGLAVLLGDGPLSGIPDDDRDTAIDRTMDAIIAGICTQP